MSERIEKVGIIGEGKMGTGIFYYLLDFDLKLIWVCSQDADMDKIIRQYEKKVKRFQDSGIIDRERFEKLMTTVITKDISRMADCDLIIEAIPEDKALKKELFSRLDETVSSETIFATNSSSLIPGELTPPGNRAGKFIGMHFFYPVPLKNIVEVTLTSVTEEAVQQTIESFLDHIQRRFLLLDERNSFILNRIFLDFQNEAYLIVNSGQCSYRQMDQIVKTNLFPFGVFDFCDSVGLDTMLASIRNYIRDYPHKDYFASLTGAMESLIAQGRLGVKTHAGFYDYPMEDKPLEEPENAAKIAEHLRQTWFSSCKRFTALVHLPMDDMNHAIREYFSISTGPFG